MPPRTRQEVHTKVNSCKGWQSLFPYSPMATRLQCDMFCDRILVKWRCSLPGNERNGDFTCTRYACGLVFRKRCNGRSDTSGEKKPR
ncbi:hypothetical protein POVWA2_076470 [Plasmodium ovale wallikeri]|uniref:Uncharacterized protein n=1 Tax=Plasmodium ovale wallikeri TaxID=864142 RepID=A0A1A9ALA2_PLAOA|nr:hypothetical protein POVWA1_022030 [Plasmodium ovale wallikeri]SBT56972.1 hypothetical protein POVWA2_076470 [Plasmodium ovale wallikeri]